MRDHRRCQTKLDRVVKMWDLRLHHLAADPTLVADLVKLAPKLPITLLSE